jgi:hypothetical protein
MGSASGVPDRRHFLLDAARLVHGAITTTIAGQDRPLALFIGALHARSALSVSPLVLLHVLDQSGEGACSRLPLAPLNARLPPSRHSVSGSP